MEITRLKNIKIEDLFKKDVYCNRFNCWKGGGFAIFNELGEEIAKARGFVLSDCFFYVNQEQRHLQLKNNERFNHAFAVGKMTDEVAVYDPEKLTKVIYHPLKHRFFVREDNGFPIGGRQKVVFVNSGVYIMRGE